MTEPKQGFEAVTTQDQLFLSGRIAYKKGRRVVLRFGSTMVTVHKPDQSDGREGHILFTHSFDRPRNVATILDDGIVTEKVFFQMLSLDIKSRRTECKFCGKGWPQKLGQKEAAAHLAQHRKDYPPHE